MKVYITVILACLNKCHVWESSGSEIWPKMLLANQMAGFLINCRTLKLAVSHKEINKTNLFLV